MSSRISLSRLLTSVLAMLALAPFAVWSSDGDGGNPEQGKELYEARCGGCHSVDANRIGPMHMGVFGRKAGSVTDFEYSKSVKKAKIVWNDKTLDAWLTNPEKLIPGQAMGYQVESAGDRADIIAYLKTVK
jgi:cytochrome c